MRSILKLTNHEFNWLKGDGLDILNYLNKCKKGEKKPLGVREFSSELKRRYETFRDRLKVMSEIGLIIFPRSLENGRKPPRITELGEEVLDILNRRNFKKDDLDHAIFGPTLDEKYKNRINYIILEFNKTARNDIEAMMDYIDDLLTILDQCSKEFGDDCLALMSLHSFLLSLPGSTRPRIVKGRTFRMLLRILKKNPTLDDWLKLRPDILDRIFSELDEGDQTSINALHLVAEFRESNGEIPQAIFEKIIEMIPSAIDKEDESVLVGSNAIIEVLNAWSNSLSHKQKSKIQKVLINIMKNENYIERINIDRVRKVSAILALNN